MDEIIYIAVAATKGKCAETLALILIRDWGVKYKSDMKSVSRLISCEDVYSNLLIKGTEFPVSTITFQDVANQYLVTNGLIIGPKYVF